MPKEHAPTPEAMKAILDIEESVDRLTEIQGHMASMGVLMTLTFRKLMGAHEYAMGKQDQAGFAETYMRYKDIL
jgi:hypothetical protein